ncbi:family 20 glycosylhydrolase [Dysgonomonas sp. Shenzhen-Wh21]|jgi:hexosaminidase|uniref:beta-N-acetylhexosaminidase n=1 Tax=Dysgonomonas TaxID=156973 RepID=UPI00208E1207|nr:family 20 glycosylhydrolase [Dysgonomonas mossii]MBS5979273.1 family 20 glycosylhydrolase [Dysgonomonas mossii]
MKNIFTFLFLICILLTGCINKDIGRSEVPVIPIPKKIISKNGQFTWDKQTSIVLSEGDADLRQCGEHFQQILNTSSYSPIELRVEGKTDNAVFLTIDPAIEGAEAYTLDISEKQVSIKANSGRGIFYGIQTLLQMMPPEVYESKELPESFVLPAVSINDKPQFSYRGMHLDVSRNFMTAQEVKKYIDMLAMYKFNTFHWHLTDGAGWRVEIKKYPLLTKKTAFRAQKTWKEFWFEGGRKFVDEGTPGAYGGYYTQEEIKDIVAYAKDRYITIIPEIEMPAHSEEVFVAYPHLSCSGIPYKDSDFCAGNEETFSFIEDVLDEILELFPSEYIHIGGDEAAKTAWKTCRKCQERIRKENLKDIDELQSYFIKRVSQYLTANERKLIGWDEIIDGGLAKDATVMLWRDPQTAIKAASQGHNVIMTPGSHCYFDSYQADPTTEPEAIGGYLPLRKVYSFNVVPCDSLASKFIGGQGNLWAEYIPDYSHMEYMAFPRAIALSEVLWSDSKSRNWDGFKQRLAAQFVKLDYLGVNYRKPGYELDMFQVIDTTKRVVKIHFETEQINPEIRYTLDGSIPDTNSQLYLDTIVVENSKTLNAAIFKDDKPQHLFTKDVGFHLAAGKKVTYLKKWTSYPAGGETALTDVLVGSSTYSDGLWQGFTSDMEVVIDFENETTVNAFSANFMQLTGPGVYMPVYVEIFGSNDGENFTPLLKIDNNIPREHDRLVFKKFSGTLQQQKVRYLKVFAKNKSGFIFTDELIIN